MNQEIIENVRKISPAAARYLQEEGSKLSSWDCHAPNLSLLFTWGRTPQGYAYWKKINDSILLKSKSNLGLFPDVKNIAASSENKRKQIKIVNTKYSTELHFMKNGHQWTAIEVDNELLKMMQFCIKKYFGNTEKRKKNNG